MDANSDKVRTECIDLAIDKSTHELQLLANFYLRHGHDKQAGQLLRLLTEIRQRDADQRSSKNRQTRGKSA